MYIYCVCPAMSKSTKQLPNWLKRAGKLSFSSFLMVSSVKSALIYCYRFLSRHEFGTRKTIS